MADDQLDEGRQGLDGAAATLGKLAAETIAAQQDPPTPDDDEKPDDGAPPTPDDDAAPPEPDDDAAQDQHVAPDDEDDDAPPADQPDEMPVSLSELAEALEVDDTYINGLTVTRKINGEDHTVTLGEVLSGIGQQKQVSDLAGERRTLDEQRQAFEAEKTQQAEQLQAVLANLDSLIAQDDPEDLDALADEDPVAYIQAVQRRDKREKVVEKAKSEAQEILGKQQAEQFEKLKAFAAEETQKFRTRHPDLAEDAKFNAEMTDVVGYLQKQGFSDDEIRNTYDSRLWGVALQAMRFERAATKAPDTRRKVNKLPKVLRPGSTEGRQAAGTERLAKARGRLKRTGSVDDAVALFKQLAS